MSRALWLALAPSGFLAAWWADLILGPQGCTCRPPMPDTRSPHR
jgi:hypothetical protein